MEGGEQCSQRNYNVLSKILNENNVDTYYIHDESKKHTLCDYIKGIMYFFQNYYFGLTPSRVDEIVNLAQSYEVVFIDRSVFGILAKSLKDKGYKGKVICFFHNVEVSYFNSKIGKHNPLRNVILNCVDKNDYYSCKYADKTISLNQRDEQELFEHYKRHADILIPIAFKDKYKLDMYPQETTRPTPVCLFLGTYFPPNNEGIEWFINNVYPYVNIKMKIVGKGMAKLKMDMTMPDNIELVSDAPDLRPYFEEADIMILPIFKGSGMKVKTCESLMYGKNIIATDEAFMGYEVDYEKVGAKCNTAQEFIAAINDISAHPRIRFNEYSRNVFLEKYTEDAVTEKFKQVLS